MDSLAVDFSLFFEAIRLASQRGLVVEFTSRTPNGGSDSTEIVFSCGGDYYFFCLPPTDRKIADFSRWLDLMGRNPSNYLVPHS